MNSLVVQKKTHCSLHRSCREPRNCGRIFARHCTKFWLVSLTWPPYYYATRILKYYFSALPIYYYRRFASACWIYSSRHSYTCTHFFGAPFSASSFLIVCTLSEAKTYFKIQSPSTGQNPEKNYPVKCFIVMSMKML